jgi:hypothetical protein
MPPISKLSAHSTHVKGGGEKQRHGEKNTSIETGNRVLRNTNQATVTPETERERTQQYPTIAGEL